MPWHVRQSGVVFAGAAESGHAMACPYEIYTVFWHSKLRQYHLVSSTRQKIDK